MQVTEFHYRVPWRTRASHPGYHRSVQAGGGLEFRGHAPVLRAPDPRRFDIHASLRNPADEILVRVYNQRSAIPVYGIADLSASMGFGSPSRKLDVLADFVASLGYSAYRTGDPFGFVGCDTDIRHEFLQPLTAAKGAGPELSLRLRHFTPDGADSRGLLEAINVLTQQRALVFLVSDFHFSLDLLEKLLASLARHEVVPVVLWDSSEFTLPSRFGIARLKDWETGKQRTVLLRPALREKMERVLTDRKAQLSAIFLSHGTLPLMICDRFYPDEATQYFYT